MMRAICRQIFHEYSQHCCMPPKKKRKKKKSATAKSMRAHSSQTGRVRWFLVSTRRHRWVRAGRASFSRIIASQTVRRVSVIFRGALAEGTKGKKIKVQQGREVVRNHNIFPLISFLFRSFSHFVPCISLCHSSLSSLCIGRRCIPASHYEPRKKQTEPAESAQTMQIALQMIFQIPFKTCWTSAFSTLLSWSDSFFFVQDNFFCGFSRSAQTICCCGFEDEEMRRSLI